MFVHQGPYVLSMELLSEGDIKRHKEKLRTLQPNLYLPKQNKSYNATYFDEFNQIFLPLDTTLLLKESTPCVM